MCCRTAMSIIRAVCARKAGTSHVSVKAPMLRAQRFLMTAKTRNHARENTNVLPNQHLDKTNAADSGRIGTNGPGLGRTGPNRPPTASP